MDKTIEIECCGECPCFHNAEEIFCNITYNDPDDNMDTDREIMKTCPLFAGRIIIERGHHV